MVLLRIVPLLLLVACYSPDVSSCTVACASSDDCAPNQVCGADGYCASSDLAGRCASAGGPDAKPTEPPRDARIDAPPDAAAVVVKVKIDGRGVVTLPGIGECDDSAEHHECYFVVERGLPVTLHATPKDDWRFEEWKEACDGQPTATCVITPETSMEVRARFAMTDDAL